MPAASFTAAAKGFVDDGLEVLDHFIGRRLVIVQFVHLAQVLVLAQAKAVIRQQLVINHVLVRADERQHRPDVVLVGIHRRESAACGR